MLSQSLRPSGRTPLAVPIVRLGSRLKVTESGPVSPELPFVWYFIPFYFWILICPFNPGVKHFIKMCFTSGFSPFFWTSSGQTAKNFSTLLVSITSSSQEPWGGDLTVQTEKLILSMVWKDLRLVFTGSGGEAGGDDDDGRVMGLKMGERSCRSCGVHRSWGWSGTESGPDGLANDSSTKSDRKHRKRVNKTNKHWKLRFNLKLVNITRWV